MDDKYCLFSARI